MSVRELGESLLEWPCTCRPKFVTNLHKSTPASKATDVHVFHYFPLKSKKHVWSRRTLQEVFVCKPSTIFMDESAYGVAKALC